MHDVPTHLEVQDKLVFGLTAGQTLFSAASIFIGYSLWKRLLVLGVPLPASLPVAAVASLFLMTLTLIRPEERSLDQWSLVLLRYLVQPKVYVLAREPPPPPFDQLATLAQPWETAVSSWLPDLSGSGVGPPVENEAVEELTSASAAPGVDPQTLFDPLGRFLQKLPTREHADIS